MFVHNRGPFVERTMKRNVILRAWSTLLLAAILVPAAAGQRNETGHAARRRAALKGCATCDLFTGPSALTIRFRALRST
jgi:hypothetical protein